MSTQVHLHIPRDVARGSTAGYRGAIGGGGAAASVPRHMFTPAPDPAALRTPLAQQVLEEAQLAPEPEQTGTPRLPPIGPAPRDELKPVIVWADHHVGRNGEPVNPAVLGPLGQGRLADVNAAHAGLERAGIHVERFIDETGVDNWTAGNGARVACVCLQLQPREVLRDQEETSRLISHYSKRNFRLLVVQLTASAPSAEEAEAMRVSQIICREHGVPLVLDVRSATQSVMSEVAEGYEFVEGVLQRKPQPEGAAKAEARHGGYNASKLEVSYTGGFGGYGAESAPDAVEPDLFDADTLEPKKGRGPWVPETPQTPVASAEGLDDLTPTVPTKPREEGEGAAESPWPLLRKLQARDAEIKVLQAKLRAFERPADQPIEPKSAKKRLVVPAALAPFGGAGKTRQAELERWLEGAQKERVAAQQKQAARIATKKVETVTGMSDLRRELAAAQKALEDERKVSGELRRAEASQAGTIRKLTLEKTKLKQDVRKLQDELGTLRMIAGLGPAYDAPEPQPEPEPEVRPGLLFACSAFCFVAHSWVGGR